MNRVSYIFDVIHQNLNAKDIMSRKVTMITNKKKENEKAIQCECEFDCECVF